MSNRYLLNAGFKKKLGDALIEHLYVDTVYSAAGHKNVTTTLNIYAEEFEEANAASVETVSSCISIPSANKTEE